MAKKVKTIDINKIPIGDIDNKTLVAWFGSDANKKTYQKAKKMTGSMKATLLKRAVCKCEIEDLGNGIYEISSVHEEEIPYEIYKISKGITKTLVPIILNSVMHNHSTKKDTSKMFTGETVFNLAHTFGMINRNYNIIKGRKKDSAEKLSVEESNIYEYYDLADRTVRYCMKSAMKVLQNCMCFGFDEPMLVLTKKTKSVKHTISSVEVECETSYRVATQEEADTLWQINNKIMDELKIPNYQQCFFSAKSDKFKARIKEELKDVVLSDGTSVVLFFKGYRIFGISDTAIKRIMQQYEDKSNIELIKDFNSALIKLIEDKLKNKALLDDINSADLQELHDKRTIDFDILSNATLDYFANEICLSGDKQHRVTINKHGKVSITTFEEINDEY